MPKGMKPTRSLLLLKKCDHLPKLNNTDCHITTCNITTDAINGGTTQNPKWGSPENLTDIVRKLCEEGRLNEAVNVLPLMDRHCIQAHSSTYATLLQSCLSVNAVAESKLVHLHMIKTGFRLDVFLGTKLLMIKAKCGSLEDARQVFDKLPQRNVASWNAMIAGYTKLGYWNHVLELYELMQLDGTKPDRFTFANIVSSCARLGVLDRGKHVHGEIKNNGLVSDLVLNNALIDMYVKCGNMEEAADLFDKMPKRDVISWTTMIGGYDKHGVSMKAFELFKQMQQDGEEPNPFTIASLLRACASLADLDQGKQVHGHIIRKGFESDVALMNGLIDMYAKSGNMEDARGVFNEISERDVISWTAMVAGYAKCGNILQACKFFHEMPKRNLISWSAMIAGYTESGHSEEALTLFSEMRQAGMKPDRSAFASVLRACSGLVALEQGKQIHVDIIKGAFKSDIILQNALIDMYAKCGIMEDAHRVFGKMSERNLISWTTMIVAYGRHGHGKEALQLFQQMRKVGINPNEITFVGVLSACSHAGLVDDGWNYFDSMIHDYSIAPRMEHYGCMVDLLGRNGHLQEAYDFISGMPFNASAAVWGALLNACRVYCDLDLGKCAAEQLFELEPENAGTYIALSSIYAAAGMFGDASKVRLMMKDRGIRKEPGCSWINIKDTVHAFVQGDQSHPQMQEVYAVLDGLVQQMKEVGYVPATNSMMQDMDEE